MLTRKKQISIWCYLLMTFFVKNNRVEGFASDLANDNFQLFNNTYIKRFCSLTKADWTSRSSRKYSMN